MKVSNAGSDCYSDLFKRSGQRNPSTQPSYGFSIHMRTQQENEELFELQGRDAQIWLNQAKQLKMAADSILPALTEAFTIPPALPDAQEKRFAFFHSYMLLIGLAFENLIKGICIGRDPTLVSRERIEGGILSRGGHGIADGAKQILHLDSIQSQLLCRVEEYLFWAGRYPLPPFSKLTIFRITPIIVGRATSHTAPWF